MAIRAAIVGFAIVVLLLLALAALGYQRRLKPNPPIVPPEPVERTTK
jgi:hypothetical protein